ncbi:hypothetical protein E0500_038195 [Streptomyces sp. KM273126]|uniref:hypothetical protein n=1 Tax=Streptomyces sp. KM273126 TaxID=2545247 RepID=UPI00103B431F|nr:hypothetical protein [Streptomyces sp. KM273126]MBA2812998.1 hypothetical protein [Streptomyces sp. KM273126]
MTTTTSARPRPGDALRRTAVVAALRADSPQDPAPATCTPTHTDVVCRELTPTTLGAPNPLGALDALNPLEPLRKNLGDAVDLGGSLTRDAPSGGDDLKAPVDRARRAALAAAAGARP